VAGPLPLLCRRIGDHAPRTDRSRPGAPRPPGGRGGIKDSLDESVVPSVASDEEGFQVAREALDLLARENQRAALVVALRVFGGLTVAEIAKEMSVSERTVKSDWVTARVRLKKILVDSDS
jgi:RNA polymerase sigma-70 factor (ECF subfamily)